jgi:hypothetical protein
MQGVTDFVVGAELLKFSVVSATVVPEIPLAGVITVAAAAAGSVGVVAGFGESAFGVGTIAHGAQSTC